MKLSEWLDEYRAFPTEGHSRPTVDSEDDWEEPELLASDDRIPDRSPRWLRRAERVGYGRPTHI